MLTGAEGGEGEGGGEDCYGGYGGDYYTAVFAGFVVVVLWALVFLGIFVVGCGGLFAFLICCRCFI